MEQAKRILLADDEVSFRQAIEWRLESCGYAVVSVGSGHEALKALKREKFSCVITDIRMPGVSGLEVLDKTKKYSMHSPPFILMTGQSEVSCSEAIQMGAEVVLSKPFGMEKLLGNLEKLFSLENASDLRGQRRDQITETWITFESGASSNKGSGLAKVENISRSGLLGMSANEPPGLQELAKFSLSSKLLEPNLQDLIFEGEIKWVEKIANSRYFNFAFGIEFLTVNEKSIRGLNTLINTVRANC